MKAVLLSEKQRRKIVKTVRPSKDDFFSYQNLNLLTAVCDEETGAILTQTYNLSEGIRRTGDAYDEVTYILLAGDFASLVSTNEYHYGERFRSITSPLPLLVSSAKVKDMILFYSNSYHERSVLAKDAMTRRFQNPGKRHSFTEDYLNRYVFGRKLFRFDGWEDADEDTYRDTDDPQTKNEPADFMKDEIMVKETIPQIQLRKNMKYQIVYGSRYGSARRYADRLSEITGIPAVSYEESGSVEDCNIVIHMGGLYAGGVKGLKTTLKTIKANAKLFIVTVGLADVTDQENITNIRNSLAKQVPAELLADAEIFHLRGAIDYSQLSLKHKTMMALLYQKVKKLPEEQKTAEIRAMIDTYNKKVDFVDFEALKDIVAALDRIPGK